MVRVWDQRMKERKRTEGDQREMEWMKVTKEWELRVKVWDPKETVARAWDLKMKEWDPKMKQMLNEMVENEETFDERVDPCNSKRAYQSGTFYRIY